MKTGIANLPLHGGKAPVWLFKRMCRLAGAMAEVMVEDQGIFPMLFAGLE